MKPDSMRPHVTVNPLSTGNSSSRTAAAIAVAMRNYLTDFQNRYLGKNEGSPANGWQIVGKMVGKWMAKWLASGWQMVDHLLMARKPLTSAFSGCDPISTRPQVNHVDAYAWPWHQTRISMDALLILSVHPILRVK